MGILFQVFLMLALFYPFQSISAQEALPLGIDETQTLEGFEVRTGGDTVYCAADSSAQSEGLSGYYALDYLLHRQSGERLIEPESWEAAMLRTITILSAKSPYLGRSLAEFVAAFQAKQRDLSEMRIWWPVEDLAALDDYDLTLRPEDLDADEFGPSELLHLPSEANCFKDRIIDGENLNTIQTVIRRLDPKSGRIVYLYRSKIMDQLPPLQLAMILTHEWLWDFFRPKAINQLWMLNYFMHTEAFEQATATELWRLLSDYGVHTSYLGPRPVDLNVTDLALGNAFTCVLHRGKLGCWGIVDENGLQLPPLVAPTALAASSHFVCVIDQERVLCGAAKDRPAQEVQAVQAELGKVRKPLQLFGSGEFICAVGQYDGTVCTNGGRKTYAADALARRLPDVEEIYVSETYLCTKGSKRYDCFSLRGNVAKPFLSLPRSDVQSIAVTDGDICHVTTQREVKCYESPDMAVDIDRPTQIAGTRWRQNFCAINEREIACNNSWTSVDGFYNPPVVINPKKIIGSEAHFCVLDELGVKCWGRNTNGESGVPQEFYPLDE